MPVIRLIIIWIVVVVIQTHVFIPGGRCSEMLELDATMLMFVGQELSVVSLASKMPESSAGAPALVRVITHKEIKDRGYQTISELLTYEPGIYISAQTSGSIAYMRGIRDGVLLLFDGVPISTNATRNAGYMDNEISLHGIEKVEIIRGPASVLWGADAFAGIVNLVPFHGDKYKKGEAELSAGLNGKKDISMSWGGEQNGWDVFISGHYGQERDYTSIETSEDLFPISVASVEKDIHDSKYLELTGNVSNNNTNISWRLSNSCRDYIVRDTESLFWAAKRETPAGFLKLSWTGEVGENDITLLSSYEYVNEITQNVDLKREVSDNIFYSEMMLHRSVGNGDSLTSGISFRSSKVTGAVIEDDFLPQSLKPANVIFVPSVDQENFNNSLVSLFSQYRHKWGNADTWIGVRYDKHNAYKDTISFSLGSIFAISPCWRVKIAGGTAYRTPYANNLLQNGRFDPESISSFNFEIIWNDFRGSSFSCALFGNWLEDYIYEDPYGGLSQPSDQNIMGIEIVGKKQLDSTFSLYNTLTAFRTTGEDIPYSISSYTYVDTDGNMTTASDQWINKFDAGPRFIISSGIVWNDPLERITFSGNISLSSSVPYAFEKNSITGSFAVSPVVSVEGSVKDPFGQKGRFILGCKNLLNVSNQVPGAYGPMNATPLKVYVKYIMPW